MIGSKMKASRPRWSAWASTPDHSRLYPCIQRRSPAECLARTKHGGRRATARAGTPSRKCSTLMRSYGEAALSPRARRRRPPAASHELHRCSRQSPVRSLRRRCSLPPAAFPRVAPGGWAKGLHARLSAGPQLHVDQVRVRASTINSRARTSARAPPFAEPPHRRFQPNSAERTTAAKDRFGSER